MFYKTHGFFIQQSIQGIFPGGPIASNVEITGVFEVGETLTASYDYYDPNGNPESGSIYQWYRSDNDSVWTPIGGATALTYVLVEADVAKYIRFGVIPSDGSNFGAEAYSNSGYLAWSDDFTDAGAAFDSRITFTASTARNRFNSSGVLTSTAIDVARANANQDYNPSTLAARGFLIEAGATNQIRNPRAEGASAPSTLPTNWSTSGLGTLSLGVSAPYTHEGIDCIDVTLSGTTSTTACNIFFETITGVAFTNGQTKTQSVYWQIVGGGLTNISSTGFVVNGYDSGSGFLPGSFTGGSYVPAGSNVPTSSLVRATRAWTGANASLAFGRPSIFLSFSSGVAINITLRIGAPQLEQNAFATSLILPPVASPAATARGADNAVISNLASIGYSSTQGTVVAEFMLEGVGASVNPVVISLNDGTTTNNINIYVADTVANDYARALVQVGGVSQADISPNITVAANTLVKVAISWAANTLRMAVNGTAATAGTPASMPTVTRLDFGKRVTQQHLNGWLPRVTYEPQLLTNAQLQALTA